MTAQIQSPPLQTNNIKKIVFIFAFLSSSFFNMSLFASVGYHIHTKLIYGLIGIAAVYFQTLELRIFHNIRKKKKYLHLIFYIICTIGSIAGTLGAGYAQIEKSKPSISQNQINKTMDIINYTLKNEKEPNQWATINLLKRQDKLEIKKNDIKKNEKSISSSLNGIANILKVSPEMTAFIFLIFVALILELMVFGSSTYNGKLINFHKIKFNKKNTKKQKLSKIQKEVKQGQGVFHINDFRKVG